MLEGVEILNKTEVMVPNTILWGILLAVVIVAVVLFLACLCFNNVHFFHASIICLMTALFYTIVIAVINPQVPTGRYRYEVTIDESVSICKLYERYDIVEQRGEIWVLEDKEKDNE